MLGSSFTGAAAAFEKATAAQESVQRLDREIASARAELESAVRELEAVRSESFQARQLLEARIVSNERNLERLLAAKEN